MRRWRFRRGLERADRVIAVCGATRRDVLNLVTYRPRGCCRSTTRPIRASWQLSPMRSSARKCSSGTRSTIRFLLYAGSINPRKNIPRLVEAFAVVRQELVDHPEYKDLRLIIIGDEISQHPAVRRAVHQARVSTCVRFLGFVPFDTLQVFYEGAAAFVFPSLYEGFGCRRSRPWRWGRRWYRAASVRCPKWWETRRCW